MKDMQEAQAVKEKAAFLKARRDARTRVILTRKANTSKGRLARGDCPHLPNAEALALINAGKAEYVRPPVAKMDATPTPEANHGEATTVPATKPTARRKKTGSK